MYNTVIFDFGLVLVDFYAENMSYPFLPDDVDKKAISDILFDRLYWDELDEGTLSEKEVAELACGRVEPRLHSAVREILDNWYRHLPFIEGMRELVLELKAKGTKLYLLSNISTTFADNYHTVPELAELFSHFDGLVFSGKVHITKPNKEIFEHLINKYEVDKSSCVFIDDSQRNIDGALRAGIDAYLFDRDVERLRKYLLK